MLKRLQDRRRKTEEKNGTRAVGVRGDADVDTRRGVGRTPRPALGCGFVVCVAASPNLRRSERARSDSPTRASLRARRRTAARGAASARARRIAGMKPHVEFRSGGDGGGKRRRRVASSDVHPTRFCTAPGTAPFEVASPAPRSLRSRRRFASYRTTNLSSPRSIRVVDPNGRAANGASSPRRRPPNRSRSPPRRRRTTSRGWRTG